MNRDEEDLVIKRILLEAVSRDMEEDDVADKPFPTSPRFQREMKKMLADPAGWAKKKQRPVWKKFLQTAAAIVLTFSLGIGSFMVFAPEAYAAIARWFVTFYEDRIVYMFAGKAEPVNLEDYYIAELPEGYQQQGEHIRIVDDVRTVYTNENNDQIWFAVMPVREGGALVIDTENVTVVDITVHGYQGHLYISEDDDVSSGITWYDTDNDIQFMIDGFIEADTLQKMAESVTTKK